MWLEVEGGKYINLDLVERVEPNHHHKHATLWSGGVHMCDESRMAYRFFAALKAKGEISVPPTEADVSKLQGNG